jgi:hypothetical protein
MPRTTVNEVENKAGPRTRVYTDMDTGAFLFGSPTLSSVQSSSRMRQRTTWNTDGFRSFRKEGLPMNPFTYVETFRSFPFGKMDSWDHVNRIHEFNSGYLPLGTPVFSSEGSTSSMESSIDAQALNKALKDLKSSKVNLGVALGERQKTGALITRTAQRIGNALRALRKGNISGAANALGVVTKRGNVAAGNSKALADEWLSLQYGWKPLLNDVYNAAEDLARISQEPRKFKVTASRSHRWSLRTQPASWNEVPYVRVESGSYTRKYVFIFSYSNEVLTDLSRFGVTNPASVAWELLPWSFVIDWFIPIGDYIDVWDATLGFTFEKGCSTVFKKYEVNVNANGTKHRKDVNTTYRVAADFYYLSVFCQRVALGSFPLPRLPSFDPRISFNRGVSTAALLRQRLRL